MHFNKTNIHTLFRQPHLCFSERARGLQLPQTSFEPVWKELGELIADPFVYMKGKEYKLDIVCGSDYKEITQYIYSPLNGSLWQQLWA